MTFVLPTVWIPGPFPVSISSDATISGPPSSVNIGLNTDGSISLSTANSNINISSESVTGAISNNIGSNTVSVGTDGISVTRSISGQLGNDSVIAEMTATVHPPDSTPSSIDLVPVVEGAGQAVGAIGLGLIIWWAVKPLCVFTGPIAPACTLGA